MTASIPFVEFPKIPRLKRDIIITEKIDGTNASILVPEDGSLFKVTIEKDEAPKGRAA